MMLTGANLIKTSGQLTERAERLKIAEVEPVAPMESPAQGDSLLDEETQSALLRFARFFKKEEAAKPKVAKKPAARGLPQAYQAQIEMTHEEEAMGATLDIYA